MHLDQNIIISFLGQGRIRIYQTVVRRNIVCSRNVLEIFDFLAQGQQTWESLEKKFSGIAVQYADATTFTLWECMLFNPDNYAKDLDALRWESLGLEELFKLFEKTSIVHATPEVNYDLDKKGPFDRLKGTLHQQLGCESMFRKQSLEHWWAHQKFNDDMASIKETPYKYIQEKFLEGYFKSNLTGKKVLEIGCGTGYYSRKMASHASVVVGLDYQQQYITIAQERSQGMANIQFYVADIVEEIKNEEVLKGGFDYIFFIDIFLFFFSGEFQNSLVEHREKVLKKMASLLKRGGQIVIMDPSLFWLTPRLGETNFPYGVITEYKQRHFKVIPTLEELTKVFYNAGIVISRIWEPDIDEQYANIDSREFNFMKQFPQWWVFELKKAD